MSKRNYNRRYAREYNWFMSLCYCLFVMFIVIPVAKIMYCLKIEGRDNIDASKKYLCAPNHVSYLDPAFTSFAVQRKIAYMAKEELFFDKSILLRIILKTLGGFAVKRDNPEIATFKTVFDILKTDWLLGIFPQGTISKDKKLRTIHKGFVTIAKKSKTDILPIGICNFTGYSKRFLGKHMMVKIGVPISYKLDDDEIIENWVSQICELTEMEKE